MNKEMKIVSNDGEHWELLVKEQVVIKAENLTQFIFDLMTLNSFLSSEIQALYNHQQKI